MGSVRGLGSGLCLENMKPETRNIKPETRILDAFRARFGDAEGVRVGRAPGRVNLIGEHTDYNDGFVLPMPIDRAAYAALRLQEGPTSEVYALNFGEAFSFSVGEPLPDGAPSWAPYVAGVVAETQRGRGALRGVEGVIWGDVPLGAGLSSSAALEVAVAMAMDALLDVERTGEATAKLCQAVEHRWAGVACGIMDQFASRLGRADHALFLDCRSLAYRAVPLPLDEARVVIVDSRARRELATSAYNERRATCEAATRFFQQIDPSIQALRDVSLELFERYRAEMPDVEGKRAEHVIRENQRVAEAAEALERRDLGRFGRLMNGSHASLRDLYEVSSPELDVLAHAAQALPGVWGARMTGAGFGGCTVNLVRADAVERFRTDVTAAYAARFDREPDVYVVEHSLEAEAV